MHKKNEFVMFIHNIILNELKRAHYAMMICFINGIANLFLCNFFTKQSATLYMYVSTPTTILLLKMNRLEQYGCAGTQWHNYRLRRR